MHRDTIDGDVIVAFTSRCTDSSCSVSIFPQVAPFAAGRSKGVGRTLRVEWDQANRRFLFTVDPSGVSETLVLGYEFSDSTPPAARNMHVSVNNSAANCQSGPRAFATMNALFDNVMINP